MVLRGSYDDEDKTDLSHAKHVPDLYAIFPTPIFYFSSSYYNDGRFSIFSSHLLATDILLLDKYLFKFIAHFGGQGYTQYCSGYSSVFVFRDYSWLSLEEH